MKVSQEHGSNFGHFDQQKGLVTSIRIAEQPILLTKSKITRPGYNFAKYFR